MAAYFGLLDLARLRSGETVLVSAGRCGRRHGRTDRDAQGCARHRHREQSGKMRLGDAPRAAVACINKAAENVSVRLKALAPRGVDIYFDNTGGELLDTIVAGRHLAAGGRIVQNTVKAGDPRRSSPVAATGPATGRAGAACQGARLRASARGVSARRDRLAWRGPHRRQGARRRGTRQRSGALLLAMQDGNFGRSLVRV